jgi:hypothetical protein
VCFPLWPFWVCREVVQCPLEGILVQLAMRQIEALEVCRDS